MQNKQTYLWTKWLKSGRLFQWLHKRGQKQPVNRFPQEEDLDHLGALHSAATKIKKR